LLLIGDEPAALTAICPPSSALSLPRSTLRVARLGGGVVLELI
jgi:hypothetical protein